MEKQICTMAWGVEVTFYREIEGTENPVSYLPSKWIQSQECRVSSCQYYEEPTPFYRERRASRISATRREQLQRLRRHGFHERPLGKGFG